MVLMAVNHPQRKLGSTREVIAGQVEIFCKIFAESHGPLFLEGALPLHGEQSSPLFLSLHSQLVTINGII